MKKSTAMKYANLLNNGKSVQYWWADIQSGAWCLKNSSKRTFKSVSELKAYFGDRFNCFLTPCDN